MGVRRNFDRWSGWGGLMYWIGTAVVVVLLYQILKRVTNEYTIVRKPIEE